MQTTITLHLGSVLDAALRRGTPRGASEPANVAAFRSALADCGLKPLPLSADGTAPGVGGIWYAECPAAVAEKTAARLSQLAGVDGAYVKPADGPA